MVPSLDHAHEMRSPMRITPLLIAVLLPGMLLVAGCAILPDYKLRQFRKVERGMTGLPIQ